MPAANLVQAEIFVLAGFFVPEANYLLAGMFVLAGIFVPPAIFVLAGIFVPAVFFVLAVFCASRNICVLFVLLLYVPCQQLWPGRDGQLT